MSEDPSDRSGDYVSLVVRANGREVSVDRLVSIETWSEANRIPRARLVLFEGPEEGENFPLSDSETYLPGVAIEIAAGYGPQSAIIHKGVVVRHSLRIEPGVSPQLIVETADPLIAMTLARHSAVTQNKSDRAVIEALVSASGGTVGKNAASTFAQEAMVQHHASDWDLLLLRAEASGCVVVVEDSVADIVSPTDNSGPVVELQYGESIVSLEATLDATAAVPDGAVRSRAWSYAQQALGEKPAEPLSVTAPGDFGAKKLADVFRPNPVRQQSAALLADAELSAWSSAASMRAKLAAVRGTAQFQGNAKVKPATFVALSGVGRRFDGNAFVTSVRHVIRAGAWQTVIGFGMSSETFSAGAGSIAAAPAGGLVPPARGLHTGIVKKVAQDPSGDHRVLVTLPALDDTDGVWARLGQFYASKGFGAAFYPEIGDEVVLGFMDEDPRSPVIVASLYSSPRAPTYPPNDANDVKSLVTRSKMEVTFDDKKVVFQIKTPKGRLFTFDDEAGTVTVADPFGNKIVMDEQKVDIFSSAALKIASTSEMTIDAGTTMTVTAGSKYALSAPQVEAIAKATLVLSSGGTGELKAAAPLTITGALVKIN